MRVAPACRLVVLLSVPGGSFLVGMAATGTALTFDVSVNGVACTRERR